MGGEAKCRDWPMRRQVIAEGLVRLRPDIVALQEVITAPDTGSVDDLLGPGWYSAPHPRTGPDGVGAVLASRWPIDDVRYVDLEFNARAARFPWSGTVVAEVTAPPPFVLVRGTPLWSDTADTRVRPDLR